MIDFLTTSSLLGCSCESLARKPPSCMPGPNAARAGFRPTSKKHRLVVPDTRYRPHFFLMSSSGPPGSWSHKTDFPRGRWA
ncbi:uncharacterized protein BJX67DRAFT_347553 [Aspergillus lucknowensis]|uniref:Actin n=1 Tax=Aspergillus lucknowensis TaxID=176173 RepID=A0ABR4LYC5_9EURO